MISKGFPEFFFDTFPLYRKGKQCKYVPTMYEAVPKVDMFFVAPADKDRIETILNVLFRLEPNAEIEIVASKRFYFIRCPGWTKEVELKQKYILNQNGLTVIVKAKNQIPNSERSEEIRIWF
jgi:hypothetical protein